MPRSTRNKTASGCGDASGELLDHCLIYLISFDANRFFCIPAYLSYSCRDVSHVII